MHIGAPGQETLSTLPGGTYGVDSGTSMATPHVTGVTALLAAQDPTRDWRAIKNLILTGGDPNSDLAKTVSGRRLDAFKSLTCANSAVQGRLLPTTDVISGSIGAPVVLSVLNINCAQPGGLGNTLGSRKNGVCERQSVLENWPSTTELFFLFLF